jgi:hypothetical protein
MAARDLLEECNEAMSLGLDFPMLWHSVIKPHEAVAGIPTHREIEGRPLIEIPSAG